MNSIVKKVKTTAEITFRDGSKYVIPFVNSTNTDLSTYGTECKLKQSLYKGTSSNVIGNICCGYASIKGKSTDKLLLPTNKDSVYYGMMDNTALIKLTCLGDDNVSTFMGVYFVDTWRCGASSSDSDTFNISCVDILSVIKKITLSDVRIKKHTKFSEYLASVIDAVNDSLPNDLKIIYSMSVLENIDKLYNQSWSMYFNNIDSTNIENIFNALAQNTLSYIWVDRNNNLQVDSLLDDDSTIPVCDLSGRVNLLDYNIEEGDISAYSGVSVNYIERLDYRDTELLSLSDYQLYNGNNKLVANLNSDQAIKITLIEIKCGSDVTAVCTKFSNYKNEINMVIRASAQTKASIHVFGQVMDAVYNNYDVYKDNAVITDNVLKIDNHILRAEDIPTYTENFVRLISMKNASISVNGFINPQIKLSDMVNVEGVKLGIDGRYKVLELEYSLGTNYRCKASLMKTTEGFVSPETFLLNDNIEVIKILSGVVNNAYVFYTPTSQAEEDRIEDYLGSELDSLRAFL